MSGQGLDSGKGDTKESKIPTDRTDSSTTEPQAPESNKTALFGQIKPKRTSLACIRCRTRHIRCPGGDPCKKCLLAKSKCEYVEADKKIVVSMKYLSKLHDDIARLKKDNAMLRNNLKEEEIKSSKNGLDVPSAPYQTNLYQLNSPQPLTTFDDPNNQSTIPTSQYSTFSNEVIQPTLDKHGRIIESRTGEKVYVGSSSMTLFGLEIQNMIPSCTTPSLFDESSDTPLDNSPGGRTLDTPSVVSDNGHRANKRQTEILEKEGNAYKIILAKTNTRPGLSIDLTLPSYSYAMLLVDTFVNYNDGCFYFFNEGLVKRYLMNLYSGKTAENKKIMRRNLSHVNIFPLDENEAKKIKEEDTILETIWFCKILLIFATGEMYLGTESDTHMKTHKEQSASNIIKRPRNKSKESENVEAKGDTKTNSLPGSKFFHQASELFTGLFASGAIDNVRRDGGVEAMLLYAFYLQVADCTVSSYFYFGMALRAALILGWHVDADKENLNRFELEHRRRIWWTVYMYERMLSSKAGLPLSFADASVSTELPSDFDMRLVDFPKDEKDVRAYYIFPPNEYIKNCVTITQINAIILSALYTKQPTVNILPVVSDLVHKLLSWKNSLPDFLKVDFSADNMHVSRLVVNLMTEYFQGMNLAVRPLLFHFATKKLKELQFQNNNNKYVDLTKYSKNVLSLLNSSFQASISTIKCIWSLLPENMVALFGWMDREYLFTSASTLILFNASFGVHDATKEHLDHALVIFTRMKDLGNYPAALRRAQLLKLISVLDFNGVMSDLLAKHDVDDLYNENSMDSNMPSNMPSSETFEAVKGFRNVGDMSATHASLSQDNLKLGGDVNPDPKLNNSDFDFLQFSNASSAHMGNQPNPMDPTSADDTLGINLQMPSGMGGTGDIYNNSDLAGIEGLTYLDEEQQLWNEITNDAVWLNVPNTSNQLNNASDLPNKATGQPSSTEFNGPLHGFDSNSRLFGGLSASNFANLSGGYSDIINQEFQDIMGE